MGCLLACNRGRKKIPAVVTSAQAQYSACMATKPIACFVAGNKGYVWDADGAMRLRKKHRIMGCLVGSVAQFKNQNEVNYLPLELSADEVTLAVQQGWIELFPETSAPVRAAAVAAAAAAAAARAAAASGSNGGRQPSYAVDPYWEAAYQEYYSQFDSHVGFTGRFLPLLGAKRRQLSHLVQPAAAEAGGLFAAGGARNVRQCTAPSAATEASRDRSEPGWRVAVTEGGPYTLPLTAAVAAAARAGTAAGPSEADAAAAEGRVAAGGGDGTTRGGTATVSGAGETAGWAVASETSGSESDGGVIRVGWRYPTTWRERLRFAVFCDLHRQGFMMTGGIKFGSDMLAYPGDPSLYHAQFTVRPVGTTTAGNAEQQRDEQGRDTQQRDEQQRDEQEEEEEVLNPMVLKAVARGSHAARKHLLLAYCEGELSRSGGQPPRIRYMSFAPEAGFGSKA